MATFRYTGWMNAHAKISSVEITGRWMSILLLLVVYKLFMFLFHAKMQKKNSETKNAMNESFNAFLFKDGGLPNKRSVLIPCQQVWIFCFRFSNCFPMKIDLLQIKLLLFLLEYGLWMLYFTWILFHRLRNQYRYQSDKSRGHQTLCISGVWGTMGDAFQSVYGTL